MGSGMAQRKVQCWYISKSNKRTLYVNEKHPHCYLQLNTDVFEVRKKSFFQKDSSPH